MRRAWCPVCVVTSWLRRSIAHRIALAGGVLAAVLVVGLAASSYAFARATMVAGVHAELSGRAALLAERFETALAAIHADVGGLARSTLTANALVDTGGRITYLQPFLRDHVLPVEAPRRLALTDHAGRVIASSGEAVRTYQDQPWWTEVLVGARTHAEVIDGPVPTLLVAYPVVYRPTGLPEGALVLELELRPVLTHIVAGLPTQHSAVVRQGTRVLAVLGTGAPRSPEPALSSEATVAQPEELPPLDLRISVETPRRAALRPLRQLGYVHAIAGAVALLLAASAAWLSARWLTGPLQALSAAAEAVQRDPAEAVRFETSGEDEPAELGRSLQRMVDALREAQARLETRVAERTAELEHAEARLRAVVDNVLDAVVTMDEDGRISSFSRSAERIFGWSAGEVIGRDAGVLMPEPDRTRHAGYVAAYVGGGARKTLGMGQETVAQRKDGTTFPVEILASEFPFRGRRVFVGLVRDITDRKKIEQMKHEFVSVVSHELRTPVTSIRGALGLIQGGVAGPIGGQASKLLEIAQGNCLRLGNLIDDLLDVQRIEVDALQLELAPMSLDGLVRDAIALNQAFAARLQVEIALHGGVPALRVTVDARRFQQVMANLLSNACKYSPPGAQVEVRASVRDAVSGGSRVRVEVTDHGPGIPIAFRDRIFQKFSQADTSNARERAGTGLGLAISKALVERMGGAIGFASQVGEGSTFFFELPVVEPIDTAAA